MLLSDRDIRAGVAAGRIVLDPWDEAMMQPSSVDVRLDKVFRVFENHRYPVIDPAVDQPELTREVVCSADEPFVLHPGEFVLGATWERVGLGVDVAARLEGKSSLGRLGLMTHSTAGFVDPGFEGHVTLELSNVANLPIKLYPGMKIGQLCFFQLSSAAEVPYGSAAAGSHYQGQRLPHPVAVARELPPDRHRLTRSRPARAPRPTCSVPGRLPHRHSILLGGPQRRARRRRRRLHSRPTRSAASARAISASGSRKGRSGRKRYPSG